MFPLLAFARNLIRRSAVEKDLDAELRAHVDLLADEKIRAGMLPDAARRSALVEVGGVEHVKEQVRDVRLGTMVETTLQDVRYAARSLSRTPGFTAAAIIALAVGIGANTAILGVVNGVLLRPLAYKDPQQLVVILNQGRNPVGPANFLDWRDQNRSFAGMGAAEYWTASLSGVDKPEKLYALRLTADVLPLLGVPAFIGRTWTPAEDQLGSDHEIVLSYRLWQRRFAGDSAITGRKILLDGEPYTVIGVMPAKFQFAPFWATKAELWAPLALGARALDRGGWSLRVFGRLRAGVTIEAARADIGAITARIEQQFPGSNADVQLTSLTQRVVGDVRTPLLVLMGAVGFVLLIACANVAHMLLARAAVRQREIAVRVALGATRGRMIRQLLTESALLSIAGGAGGVLLALYGNKMLVALGGSSIPRLQSVAIDGRVLAFTVVISLASAVAFGLVPALRASAVHLSHSLKDAGRGSSVGERGARTRNVLIASEFALALVLLIGAGLMIRSFAAMRALDPGFDPRGVLSAVVSVTGSAESAPGRRAAFYEGVLTRLAALPGVQSVSAINHLPLAGDLWGWPFWVEGRPIPKRSETPSAAYRAVFPGYFRTMGIPIVKGRDVAPTDRLGAPAVVVVNEWLANHYWPGENPIGKRMTFDSPQTKQTWVTVVGVTKNGVRGEWTEPVEEEVFLPFLQEKNYLENASGHFAYATFVVRATCSATRDGCDSGALAPAVREAVWSLDRSIPLSEVQTMEQVVAGATAQPRFYLVLLATFAAVALLLAAVGINGVMSYSVARRTHEIGLRLALGATPWRLLGQVVREGMVVAAVGAGAGLAGALALTRLLSRILYGVAPLDLPTFVVMALVLGAVALVASYIPARRATVIDPLTALRSE